MTKRNKILSLLLYVLIVAAVLLLVFSVLSRDTTPRVSYSQMRELFLNEQVESFEWKNGLLTLQLNRPLDGAVKVAHELADYRTFREDMDPTINALQQKGVLKSFNYVPVSETPWFLQLLPYVLLIGLMLVFMYLMLSRAAGGGGSGMVKFSRANIRVGTGDRRYRFDDVAGADEEKAELEEIVDFLRNPDKYRAIGAKIPRGVLLSGSPGTGKTLLAKAVAGEANVQFLSISGSDFLELYVGVGASRVRDLFEQAKRVAPAIVFIDEIDAVGRRRGAGLGGGNDEREQTLNQLLVEMDGFAPNDGVIVMAATNRPDVLDPALLRPGRFDRRIYVSMPDAKGREAILRVHARNKKLAEDVDLRTLANATAGFTGADLENLLNEAALLSVRRDEQFIRMATVEEAILKVVAGPEKRSRTQLARDLRVTAYHEAGHAVASYHLPTQDPVSQITIVPRGNALGMTISFPEQDRTHYTRNEMRESLVMLLGGRVAEALEFDDVSSGASNDLQRASRIAYNMVARYGMSERLGAVSYDDGDEIFVGRDYERMRSYSERVAGEIDAERKRLIDAAYAECEDLLRGDYDKLRQVAEYLIAHETMSRSQFEAVMRGEPVPGQAEPLLHEQTSETPHDGE